MYKTVAEVNYFEDENLRKQLTQLSVLIVVVPLFVIGLIGGFSAAASDESFLFSGSEGLSLIERIGLILVVSVVALPVHELIHALWFKVFCPQAHIVFGFKAGMLYASCPGEIFKASQFCWILLAPAVLLTLLFALLAIFSPLHALFAEVLFIHLSGCTGDFLGARAIWQRKECTHCEDTNFGIRLLQTQ